MNASVRRFRMPLAERPLHRPLVFDPRFRFYLQIGA